MEEVLTTSYSWPGATDLIASFTKVLQPKVVVEIGTQQGFSAISICKGLDEDALFYTFDLFEDTYPSPPYASTFASQEKAISNMKAANLSCSWMVQKGSYKEVIQLVPKPIDLLHVDICNHYHNLFPILEELAPHIRKGMILEGGMKPNRWQEKYSFTPWYTILQLNQHSSYWNTIPIPLGKDHNAVTLCVRK